MSSLGLEIEKRLKLTTCSAETKKVLLSVTIWLVVPRRRREIELTNIDFCTIKILFQIPK